MPRNSTLHRAPLLFGPALADAPNHLTPDRSISPRIQDIRRKETDRVSDGSELSLGLFTTWRQSLAIIHCLGAIVSGVGSKACPCPQGKAEG
ncbi:hypothetical protein AVEN_192553-1 [Araneus ventricosus]|uniref:Uncharacterized protein n=1 Tax=Araneus ventricosus TaxID=182803 RepID=A0A4Y2FVF5_ARAVE|nr:hypothetical protein AVEN_192553-1 [Araneus ventricosus]